MISISRTRMLEEIKTDNNCIVKAFENNPVSILEEDLDNKKIYYFKASDIGKVLDIVNIRTSIVNFDEDEKVVRTTYSSNSGNQDTIFLTSRGVYRLLYSSKKEIAKKFRKWASDILDDIIFNQSNELRNQLKEKEQQLIQTEERSELEKEILLEKTLLSQFPQNTQCIYYGKIDDKDMVGGTLVKFGMSNNLQERVKSHRKTYANFRLKNAFKVTNQIEIENCIKKHPVLKKRIRNLMIDGMNYRELIYVDKNKNESDFSLEQLDEYIKEIVNENQYNLENYKRLLQENNIIQNELYKSKDDISDLKSQIEKLQKQLVKFTPSVDEKKFQTHNKIETSGGYSLFAFICETETKINRYKIALCKTATIETREKVYKSSFPSGKMKLHTQIKHPFIEKILIYLLKRHLTFLNNYTFDGSEDDIKLVFNIISQLESFLINNDLHYINNFIRGDIDNKGGQSTDPEVPFVRKAKRSIDQIDKNTGVVLHTYQSIEAAGRALGLTTGTAIGVALRNKSLCQDFLWRYSGISKEDQMLDQPVVRTNCNTGERTNYPNIASAAKAAKISPPGLRNRILTDVHINNYHWIFDKTASHYV